MLSGGESTERVLFVHAHPDDETISTGGVIATLIDAGAAVTVVTCTRGELGEVVPHELQHLSGDALGEYRAGELAEAMRVLGVADARFLGALGLGEAASRADGQAGHRYRDSGMQWGVDGAEPLDNNGDNDASDGGNRNDEDAAETLTSAGLERVTNDLISIIVQVEPTTIVSYNDRGGYGHPDHVRAHDAAKTAAYICGIPFYEIVPDGLEEEGDLTVDVSAVLDRKKHALNAYRTQLTVEGNTIVHSGGQVEQIRSVEVFRRHSMQSGGELDWSRLGIFTKVITSLLAFAIGALMGAVGTANHEFAASSVALLISAGFIVGLRLLFGIRTVALFGALGLLLTVGVFSLKSPGGSVLIQADLVGYVWTYALPVIALIVLAWPSISRRTRATMKGTIEPKKVVGSS